eukprot:7600180-Ditylum_brightwellii.AAC.1
MSNSPNTKHVTGGLKVLVGNVVKKILVPISSTSKPITEKADLLVHVYNVLSCVGGYLDILDACLKLLHTVKSEGPKRSNNGN